MPIRSAALCAAAASAAMLAWPIAGFAADTDIVVETTPPPAVVETAPAPRPGYIWSPGYQKWEDGRYVWTPGHWVEARVHSHWVPDSWEKMDENHWRFRQGHWQED